MSTEIADASRVLEWMRAPNRKTAQLAFTHGPEHQAAYWIEIAQSEPEVAAQNIDARFAHRLAIALECMILNPTRFYDEACALIDEYKSAWEEVNPSLPTFMGEPIGLPFDGETFDDSTPGETADRLEWLRGLGYRVPQRAIDVLREEQAEMTEKGST